MNLRSLNAILTILFGLSMVASLSAPAQNEPALALVPPGRLVQGARVEFRLAVKNPGDIDMTAKTTFTVKSEGRSYPAGEQTITIPAGEKGLVQIWFNSEIPAGKYVVHYTLTTPAGEDLGTGPLEVIASPTRALPIFQGMWIEPFAVLQGTTDARQETLRRAVKDCVEAMDRLGVRILILAYVEYMGQFYYPSAIEFFDADAQRLSSGTGCDFDLVGAFLSEADARGMYVFLGLGRSGDTNLLWEFDRPDWDERNARAAGTANKVASELWQRYGDHPSFYGWYLSHEMADLARASAHYDPVARHCHGLAPEKPVLVAPAGTPVITPELLAASAVDIFAYQDAVGAGYVPYEYTYLPEKRMAMLDEVYTKYAAWHATSSKHFWSDLEIWEMNGSQGYGGSFPASFLRVKQQIDIECRHAEVLTAYAYHGYMQAGGGSSEKPVPLAQTLYSDYVHYLESLPCHVPR